MPRSSLRSISNALVLTLALCGVLATSSPEETPPPPQPPPTMETPIEVQVAHLVDAIAKDPSQADALLLKAGMTEHELKAHLHAIARDAGRTKAYQDARKP